MSKMNILEVDPFDKTFGPSSTRKRPKLSVEGSDYEGLLAKAEQSASKYEESKDSNLVKELDMKPEARLSMFDKGQSKRIWGELFKVIDSSDVLVQVLDARDPMGTRSKYIEETLKKNSPHKHMVLLLNKCDLVPVWATVFTPPL